jgi:PAB-dependent poly(A)-specific ribonuclease subunit 3
MIEACSGGKFSPSLVEVIKALIGQDESSVVTASTLLSMCGSYVAFKAEQLESGQDMLMAELRKTVDVNRIQRMLYKVCAIADRAHLLDDWRWSSTGDRYIVQLFRDYVFFQVDDTGRPFFDVGHVSDCLAKVDVGSFEPIMLMNRDGSSVLVTNYHDIRRCIEASFKEIAEASAVVAPPRR